MDAAVGWFADPIYLGNYPESMKEMLGDRLPEFTSAELELLKDSSEFFGANTYTTNIVQAGGTDESAGKAKLGFVTKDGETIGWECKCDHGQG
jgi:beta-glucosidase